jgi:bifunctional DNase/RNase
MLIEMKVDSLTVDPFTNMPIVILRGAEGHELPLWVGMQEAPAIAAELESIPLDRPMTHDLLKTILGLCAVTVDHVEVHDLRGGAFFATLVLHKPDGAKLHIDARPSDAIALALRTRAPIFVAKKVVDKARKMDLCPAPLPGDGHPELEGLAETAFGKWKM